MKKTGKEGRTPSPCALSNPYAGSSKWTSLTHLIPGNVTHGYQRLSVVATPFKFLAKRFTASEKKHTAHIFCSNVQEANFCYD